MSIHIHADHPAPLPIRVRPRQGETVESYIRRLARANHLRPSYLRSYLCRPPHYIGAIRPERLAVLASRTLYAITRAFPELGSPPRRPPTSNRRTIVHTRRLARAELFAAIRRASATGLSVRALAARFQVHRRTVRQALIDPLPPPRRQRPRRSTRLDHLHTHIEAMIQSQPDLPVQRIWERLLDEHDAEVAPGTVRDYVSRLRLDLTSANRDPGQIH